MPSPTRVERDMVARVRNLKDMVFSPFGRTFLTYRRLYDTIRGAERIGFR
jgi:hypothetical protein